ncbi:hypothetical protein B5F40_01090 [Gordonibacter sp. An230]|uniref:LuxR family transcriptional regulator n=1 Tax=Gordonibacter sp. An230 TaxID=1965592 RepID=UPI000B3ADD8A|nr:helix-turn-helix transcriptional regulator [Gordonibacter sp. An230]OUO92519.1 hypothetical protein B5F40_01090 [Gordonibacter sp. An230]
MPARELLLIALGGGTNLSLYGIGVWNGSTVLTGGSLFGPDAQTLSDWYVLFATVGMLLGILARAAISAATGANGRFHVRTTCGTAICAAVLLLGGFWTDNLFALCLAGLCTGWTYACLQVFWMTRISMIPSKARIAFPLVLACSALANAWYASTPRDLLHIFLAVALLTSTACSIVLFALGADSRSPLHPIPAYRLKSEYILALKQFAEVLFCVIALQTVAPTMNYMGLMNTLDPATQLGVVCVAQTIAAGVVLLVLGRAKGHQHSVQLFKFATPVLILALFPVPFAGHPYSLGVLLAGSCLHFVVVSVLFCVDAASLARQNRLTFELFYSLGYFVLMTICVALEYVMPMVLRSSNSAELLLVFGVFFCIYVLSMAFMHTRKRKQEARDDRVDLSAAASHPDAQNRGLEPSTTSPVDPSVCVRALQVRHGLSDREAQVVGMLLRGKNVPAIAEELFISQNTVRSHVKRIYRATGIHARQDLISYCERIGENGEIT